MGTFVNDNLYHCGLLSVGDDEILVKYCAHIAMPRQKKLLRRLNANVQNDDLYLFIFFIAFLKWESMN